MKKNFLILTAIFSLVSVSLFSQTETTTGILTFKVTGFESSSGQAILMLYRPADNVPKTPFKRVTAEILNKESVITVKDLPYGEYAAILVHDKNKNGIIDHKWGMPAEPLGYTNHWKLSLFSGMPNFEKLKFRYSESCSMVVVSINN